jgi:hypothetical protein
METRIKTEVKVFDIVAQGQVICGHGYSYDIPPIIWAKGQIWESDTQCEELLQQAIKDWEMRREDNPWGTTDYKPQLKIYWKNT